MAGAHLSNGKERWEPRDRVCDGGLRCRQGLVAGEPQVGWSWRTIMGGVGLTTTGPCAVRETACVPPNHQAHPPECARACACTCVCARAPSDLPHSAHRVTPVRGLCPNARVPRLPACPPVSVHAHTHTRARATKHPLAPFLTPASRRTADVDPVSCCWRVLLERARVGSHGVSRPARAAGRPRRGARRQVCPGAPC